jgi:hypothetical protein
MAVIFPSPEKTQLKRFRFVFYALIAFVGVAFLSSFATTDYTKYLNQNVARKMHGKTVGEGGEAPKEEKLRV